jgi:hypothetical protein
LFPVINWHHRRRSRKLNFQGLPFFSYFHNIIASW